MCYVLKFNFDDSYKACKFTAFPRIFQIINYLFFKEVCKHNVYSVLHNKIVNKHNRTFKSTLISFFSFMNSQI